jgi:hypothetical protein
MSGLASEEEVWYRGITESVVMSLADKAAVLWN